jgi:hypothetical protein
MEPPQLALPGIVRGALPAVTPGPTEQAGWLEHPYTGTDPLVLHFRVAVLSAAARMGLRWATGTWFVVRATEPTTAGTWHSDTGEGVRFVAAAGVPGCAQEFADFTADPGDLVVYTTERHRRPATGSGLRAFMSATLYTAGQPVDLTCHRLAGLTREKG